MALRSGVAVASLLVGTSAWGQVQQQSQTVEEVTVTAEKQSEKSLDVPMGLTALSGEDLVRNEQTSFQDYVGTIPSVQMSNYPGFGSQIIIRGLASGVLSINPGAAIYVDDTPYTVQGYFADSGGAAPNIDTYDMSNIEVLKGPQGTLYGANALGGLLKYVTNAPDPSGFAASVMAGTSTVYNGGAGFDVHGMVNIPLADDMALRVVAYQDYDPGFIDDPWRGLKDINGTHVTGGRASLLWQPVSNFSVRLTAFYQDYRYSDLPTEYVSGPTASTSPNPANPCVQPVNCPAGPLNVNNYISQPGKSLNDIVSLDSVWNAGPMDVTSITSYSHFTSSTLLDYSGPLGAAANSYLGGANTPSAKYGSIPEYGAALYALHQANVWNEELRLQSPDPSARLTWLVGGYFEDENAFELEPLYPTTVATGAVEYSYDPPYALGQFQYPTSYEEFAGFANLDYKIIPTLDAALGGRWSVNSQTFHETANGHFAGTQDFDEPSYEHTITYSGDLRWHFIPDNMVYARLATGFVPGGGNDVTPTTTNLPHTFDPSTTKNYELGVKGTLFDDQFAYDMDIYHINWSDIQLQIEVGGHSSILNGGSAHSQGFEWDYTYAPIDGLTLKWNGDYSNAFISETTLYSSDDGALSGAALPLVPMWQSSANIDYERPIWGEWSGFAGADVRYSDYRWGNFIPGPVNPSTGYGTAAQRAYLPQYTMLDFRLGIENGQYSATLYCKNCTNVITPESEFQYNAQSNGAGYQQAVLFAPRTIGVELAAKF
jgi:iron complex outermembrane recepter protein